MVKDEAARAFRDAEYQRQRQQEREAEAREKSAQESRRRLVLSFILICLGVFFCVLSTAVAGSVGCVTNYLNEMPRHPDAELIDNQMSWLNWLAIGTVAQTYYIDADYDEVRDWYTDAMIQQRQAAREAEREGVELPVWDGEFRVQRLSGRPGVVVFKESVCFRELTY